MSLAKISLSGQVVSQPEKRFTPNNTAVVTLELSVDASSQDRGQRSEPFSMKVTCWNRLAEAVAEQLSVGDNVLVEGRLMMQSVQSPEGVAKKLFEIEANTIHKLPGGVQTITIEGGFSSNSTASIPRTANNPATTEQPTYAPVTAGVAAPTSPLSEDLLTEDDIPF